MVIMLPDSHDTLKVISVPISKRPYSTDVHVDVSVYCVCGALFQP